MKITLMLSVLILSLNIAQANNVCADDAHYPLIDKKELGTLVSNKDSKIFVIDANGRKSFEKNHVPGAVHYDAIKKNFAKALPQDKNTMIVAYCGGPLCEAWKKSAEEACNLGYTNIRHFKAGISGWTAKD